MHLDCFLRDEQPLRDIPISCSRGDMTEDLHLTIAERFIAQMLRESGGDLRRHNLLAGVNLPNRLQHLLRGHALQQIPASSRFKRALNLDVALESRQHDDASLWEFRPD